MTIRPLLRAVGLWFLACCNSMLAASDPIPLPEHPRPDFERAQWLNLNGPWHFRFDAENRGLTDKWFEAGEEFPETITVPFPWGSALSQVEDKGPIAWYERTVQVPDSWEGQRIFLVIGACDWETQVWLD